MSAQVTEAHKALWAQLYNLAHREIFEDFDESSNGPATQLIADSSAQARQLIAESDEQATQLIADSEAQAVQTAMLREYGNLSATNEALTAERDQLRAEVKESKERERVAIASWDEERQRALREGGRVVELRAEVERLGRSEREARGSERDVRQILDTYVGVEARAERAEAELATERKANRDLAEVISGQDKELTAERARLDWLEENANDIMKYNCRSYIWFAHQNLRAAIDAAMKEETR